VISYNAHTTQQTQLVTKLTQIGILPIIFTLETIHPARSAITVTFMAGGKLEYLNLCYLRTYNTLDQNKILYYK